MIVKPKTTTQALVDISSLLEYPSDETMDCCSYWIKEFGDISKGAKKQVQTFQQIASAMTLIELQELYTRTFDLAPICVPYVSSYIYGDENYERGELMIRLNDHFEKRNIERHGELPDHLGLLLRHADSFTEEELTELVTFCLIDPVKQMIENIGEGENPYFYALKAIQSILETVRG